MEEFLFVGETGCGTPVYVSELSEQTLADNGIVCAPGGLYLYETVDSPFALGIRVLAAVPDIDAAYRLIDLFKGKAPI